jgi:hypothetical protein
VRAAVSSARTAAAVASAVFPLRVCGRHRYSKDEGGEEEADEGRLADA